MTNFSRTIIAVIALVVIVFAVISYKNKSTQVATPNTTTQPSPTPAPAPVATPTKQVVSPIDQADKRVTKKPFGIYITKPNSPVQPERFSGYHTGTDFETFPEEANTAVSFYAICDGKILAKRTATGYGGVLVQSCTINNQAVTVIYGHISLKSIAKNIGDSLTQGEKIGNLGQSPSETDGERKHLHLGIHLGSTVNILGYTPSQSALSAWLDFQKL